jgi:hypothetical protein
MNARTLAREVRNRQRDGERIARVYIDNRTDPGAAPVLDAYLMGADALTAERILSALWNAVCGHSSGRGYRARLVYAEGVASVIDDGRA